MVARLEMQVRFANGISYGGTVMRDTAEARRDMDRRAWHLLSKPNVVAIDVKVVTGRSAGYIRRNS